MKILHITSDNKPGGIQNAFKAFDDTARVKYQNINNLVESATGDAQIFSTKNL